MTVIRLSGRQSFRQIWKSPVQSQRGSNHSYRTSSTRSIAIGLAITSSQPMTPQGQTRLLKTSRDNVAVRDFTWLNPKGDAVYSSNPDMVGINYSDRSYFRDVVDGREWMVSELIIAKTTGELVFGISRGIRDGKGALLGVVFAAIDSRKIRGPAGG